MNLLGKGNDLVAKTAKDCCAWTTKNSLKTKGVFDKRKMLTETVTQCGKTWGGRRMTK